LTVTTRRLFDGAAGQLFLACVGAPRKAREDNRRRRYIPSRTLPGGATLQAEAPMEDDSAHFLATKTLPPRRARGVLPRPRLSGLADEIRQHLLTVVKAPAGYGKTTLALSWSDALLALGAMVAWLSLDASDGDLARFAFYLSSALGRAGVDVRRVRQALMAPLCAVDPENLGALLLNAVAEQPRQVVLIVDDCHLLAEPAVFGLLGFVCRRAPANLHLVLLGRSELPSALMSQVGAEHLLEVDAAALRFDLDETTRLVGRLADDTLQADEIGALQSTTRGWPAAVRAILLAPRSHIKLQAMGKGLVANRPIAALMEDVLDHLPPDLTDFMTRIAVVDKVSGPLAGALSGCADAEQRLAQIGQRQLFFSAHDNEQRWFSFHPLFREQLLQRLNLARRADVGTLHQRAAEWFAAQELWADAVQHALRAGDTERAIRWIEACAMRMVQTGDLLTLLSWQGQLRSHLLEMPPRLKLAFAWALGHAMATAEATRLLDQIEAGLDAADAATPSMRQECLALRALLKNVDDDGEEACRLAERCLEGDPPDAWIKNVVLNVVASSHLRTGQWQAFHSVPPLLVADGESAGSSRFIFNRCYHLCYRGIAEYAQGRLDDAAALFGQAMRVGDALLERFGIVAAPEQAVRVLPAALLAQVRYQQNRLGEATTLVAECLEPARVLAPLDFVAAAFLTAVRLAVAEGETVKAGFLLDEAEALARARGWTRLESLSLLERLRLCLIAGRLPEAEGCQAQLDALLARSRNAGIRKAHIGRDAFLGRTWIDLAHGHGARAIGDLGRRVEGLAAAHLPIEAARFGLTLALAQREHGDVAAAALAARNACELAARCGAARVLLDLPLPAEALGVFLDECRRTLAPTSAAHAFITGVMAVPSSARGDATARREVSGLSVRERDVLKLVAQGQSNKRIARELGVAPDTIKYHLKSVFFKLGVVNRAQAAVQAKSNGLA
jgi:LuxR family maltose regulon positive regulatory protein